MADQSKMIFNYIVVMMKDALFGTRRKKIMSVSIIAIIAFLIHIKNRKSNGQDIKLSKLSLKDADVSIILLRKEKETLTIYFLLE